MRASDDARGADADKGGCDARATYARPGEESQDRRENKERDWSYEKWRAKERSGQE